MKNFRDADKMLHPLCIVRCLQHHGSSSHRRRGPTVWTQTQSPGSTRAFVRFLTVRRIWRSASPLDGSGSCRLNLVPGFAVACKCADFGEFPKTCEICQSRDFTKISKKHKKNVFFGPLKKGAQLCGGSRRIIYCLDTRYGPQTMLGGSPGPPPKRGGSGSGPVETGNGVSGSGNGVSGFLQIAHFCTGTDSGISGFPDLHHSVITMWWVVAENLPGQISGLRTLINVYDDHATCMNSIPKVFHVDSVTNIELSQKRCRSFEL